MKFSKDVTDEVQAALRECRDGHVQVSKSALRFAHLIEEGYDFSYDEITMVSEAHRRLDELEANGDLEPESVLRRLWGGVPAAKESRLPNLVVDAAERSSNDSLGWIVGLNRRLSAVDRWILGRVDALIGEAVRRATKTASAVTANLVATDRAAAAIKSMCAELDVDRESMFEGVVYNALAHCPVVVAAEVRPKAVERVDRVMDTLENELAAVLIEGQDEARRVLADVLEEGWPEDWRAELKEAHALWAEQAAKAGAKAARDAALAILEDRTDIGRPRADMELARRVVCIAGCGTDMAAADRAAGPHKVGMSAEVTRILEFAISTPDPTPPELPDSIVSAREQPRLHGRFIARDAKVEVETFWTSTKRDLDVHTRLDGDGWVSEEERRKVCAGDRGRFPYSDPLHPGDHKGCGCYLDDGYRITRGGDVSTRRFG